MDKTELKRYAKINRELVQLDEQIQRLQAQIENPRTPRLSFLPGGGAVGDVMAERISRLLDLQRTYEKKWLILINLQDRIERAIDALEPMERLLMRYRYIDDLEWEDICVKLHYRWDSVHRIHRSALIKVAAARAEAGEA